MRESKSVSVATPKKYRPNVAAIILSPSYPEKVEVFVAQRIDIENAWQFPQGGIDEGEDAKEALFRELKEEIGTDEVEIIAEYPKWLSYDFPDIVAQKMYPFDGQTQKYFLVRLKNRALIDIHTPHPEFKEYKFVGIQGINEIIPFFKRQVYKEVITYFKQKGYL